MLITNLCRRVTLGLPAIASWDYGLAVVILLFTFSASALRVAFNIGHSVAMFAPEYRSCIGMSRIEWSLSFVDMHLLGITIGLLVSFVGLWSRTGVGFFVSFLGLILVGLNYVLWHRATLSIMSSNNIGEFSQMPFQSQHLLALNDATIWDIGVAVIIIFLVLWHIKTFVLTLRLSSR